MTLKQLEMEDDVLLCCLSCGSHEVAVGSVGSAHPRVIGDGITIVATVNVRCNICHRLTCYGIADMSGAVRVLAFERIRT